MGMVYDLFGMQGKLLAFHSLAHVSYFGRKMQFGESGSFSKAYLRVKRNSADSREVTSTINAGLSRSKIACIPRNTESS